MKKIYTLILTIIFSFTGVHSQVELIINDVKGFVDGMTVQGDYLYYSVSEVGRIYKINITESNPQPQTVISKLNIPGEIELRYNTLYFVEKGTETLRVLNPYIENPQSGEIISGHEILDFVLVNNKIYFVTNSQLWLYQSFAGNLPPGIGPIMDLPSSFDHISMSYNNGNIYISTYSNLSEDSDNRIYYINVETPNSTWQTLTTPSGLSYDINFYGEELYVTQWGSPQNFGIRKINNLQGSPQEEMVTSEVNEAYTSTIDGDYLYFYQDNRSISRINLKSLSITDVNQPSTKLFPNPTTNVLNISGLQYNVPYTIYNVLGTVIKRGKISELKDIDVSRFTNGMYFLKLDSGTTFKFVKE